MSPASGDKRRQLWKDATQTRFHSINVPSEWGPSCVVEPANAARVSFHSINVPSEWGREITCLLKKAIKSVSIQLMSPASGDRVNKTFLVESLFPVSIQLMSPASGDFGRLCLCFLFIQWNLVSIQLMSPASGDVTLFKISAITQSSFHSINVPSEWGPTELSAMATDKDTVFPFN